MVRRFFPLIVIAAGLFLLVGGFIYDVMFAGIPYQDPTPELLARYNYHSRIASTLQEIGFGVFLFGLLVSIIRLTVQRFR